MSRSVLIIAYPGQGENYCSGVIADVDNYHNFFRSPFGGYWSDNEIIVLDRDITSSSVINAITRMSKDDFGIVVFTGHGYYSNSNSCNMLWINENELIKESDLKIYGKQITILDCCRKIGDFNFSEALFERAGVSASFADGSKCKKKYLEHIEKCPLSSITTYSCEINEVSEDIANRGGLYSLSLLEGVASWSKQRNNVPQVLSIVGAHDLANVHVVRDSKDKQHPTIRKYRTGDYYPFCVIA